MDTAYKPTVLGQPRDTGTVLQPAPQGTGELQLASASSPTPVFLSLEAPRRVVLTQRLDQVDFIAMRRSDISLVGQNAENGLNEVVNGFMSKVTEVDDPVLFKLIRKFNDSISAEKLDDVADKIMNGKPSLGDKAKALFFGAKAREAAAQNAWEEIKRVLRAKSLNLLNVITPLELEVKTSQMNLLREVESMEERMKAYRDHFVIFVEETVFAKMLLEKATAQVAEYERMADPNNITQKTAINELHAKLQSLTSRALALEGTMTKLPADNEILRQIQSAGVQEYEETANTMVARFLSIKITLLALHSALVIKGSQMLSEKGKELDGNLDALRGRVAKDVITKAANAPGDNRVEQASRILKIVAETKELDAIVKQAEQSNRTKFDQTRQMFEQAQREMLALKS